MGSFCTGPEVLRRRTHSSGSRRLLGAGKLGLLALANSTGPPRSKAANGYKKFELPREQNQTKASPKTELATNIWDFSSPDHLM